MKNLNLLLMLVFLVLSGSLHAQTGMERKFRLDIPYQELGTALLELQTQTKVTISFSENNLPVGRMAGFSGGPVTLDVVLQQWLEGTQIQYTRIGDQIVLFLSREKTERNRYTISGYIEDAASGERLLGANIYDRLSGKGTSSNAYGFFSLTLERGAVEIIFSYLGYQPELMIRNLNEDVNRKIRLSSSLVLEEIVISAEREQLQSESLSSNDLSLEVARTLPTIGGETDILSAARLLPGIVSGPEGISGLHIRGGSPDQNLILLDDVPVYNPTHAWGVYSIFNTSAIQSVKIRKGAFPARYGGRLSSVVDVRTRDGNKKEWSVESGLGLTSVKTAIEGPVIPEKASLFLSGRRALLDLYSVPYYKRERSRKGETGTLSYFFHDINAKFNYSPNSKDKLFLSFYRGGDDYLDNLSFSEETRDSLITFRERFSQNWGNTLASFRWNRMVTKKLFANTTATYSRYFYESRDLKEVVGSDPSGNFLEVLSLNQNNSKIEDRGVKVDFDFYPNPRHTIRFGAGWINHRFQPGVVTVSEDVISDSNLKDSLTSSLDTFWQRSSMRSDEFDWYFEDQIDLNPNWSMNIGLHGSYFRVEGESYLGIQPRLMVQFHPGTSWQFGLSAESMTQNLHLLSASTIGLPTDIWVSATSRVKPQRSWQFTAGLQHTPGPNWKFDLEAYYKQMNNLIEFQEANTFLLNASNWENGIVTGHGQAYGIETGIEKTGGKTRGWINYTLARSKRKFEEINFEQYFPYRFDLRHAGNFALVRELNEHWSCSLSWTVSTGAATTLPVGNYVVIPGVDLPPISVNTYESRNAFRLPTYHHLDVGFSYEKKSGDYFHQLQLGIYNLYFRKNPIYYELREEDQYFQRFVPPFLPAISYTVKI